MKLKDWHLFFLIYLVSLIITLSYAIFRQQITSDQALEFQVYQSFILNGWHYISNSLVSTSLTATALPAIIQTTTHGNTILIFKITPCFLFSLMPSFIYLITRRYFDWRYSIIAPLLVMTNFYFLWYPTNGRVGIAQAFLAGLIWAILSKRYVWAGIFSTLIIFSHYGTAYIAIILVGVLLAYGVITKRNWKPYFVILVCLVVFAGIWYYGVSWYYRDSYASVANITKGIINTSVNSVNATSCLNLSNRDPVVRSAFSLNPMNVPQRIEWVWSWLVVGILSGGLIISLWKHLLQVEVRILAVCSYGLILLTIAVPYLSYVYGVARVYFTGMIVLAPFFVMGIYQIKQYLKVPAYATVVTVLLPLTLSVSGVIHRLFGIVK